MLGFGRVVGGEVGQVVVQQGGEDVRPRCAALRHAAAQRQGQRQATAPVDNRHCRFRQRMSFHLGGGGQHVLGFNLGGQIDFVPGAVVGKGRDEVRVATGEQYTTARPGNIERVGVRALPDIVEDQQRFAIGQQVAQSFPAFMCRSERTVAAEAAGEPALHADNVGLLPEGEPVDAVFERTANLGVTGGGIGQHALPDAPHPVYTHAGFSTGDDDGPLQVLKQDIAKHFEAFGLGTEAGWKFGDPHEAPDRRQRLKELLDEEPIVLPVRRVVAEVFRVQFSQRFGDQIISVDPGAVRGLPVEADDGIDAVVGDEMGELPFLGNVVGGRGAGTDHEEQAVTARDGVADLLVEGELSRGHVFPVEPDAESRLSPVVGFRRQILVKPPDERFVVAAGVGEEDADRARLGRAVVFRDRCCLPPMPAVLADECLAFPAEVGVV